MSYNNHWYNRVNSILGDAKSKPRKLTDKEILEKIDINAIESFLRKKKLKKLNKDEKK